MTQDLKEILEEFEEKLKKEGVTVPDDALSFIRRAYEAGEKAAEKVFENAFALSSISVGSPAQIAIHEIKKTAHAAGVASERERALNVFMGVIRRKQQTAGKNQLKLISEIARETRVLLQTLNEPT
jgi:hypothetical protein